MPKWYEFKELDTGYCEVKDSDGVKVGTFISVESAKNALKSAPVPPRRDPSKAWEYTDMTIEECELCVRTGKPSERCSHVRCDSHPKQRGRDAT